jgi:CBS domain-containing protein
MRISDILRNKSGIGASVVSISPEATVGELVDQLAEHRVGALIVTVGTDVVGIVSERDVVRRLHEHGADILQATVGELMTSPVITCSSNDYVDGIAETMTQRRFRHMPVVDDGHLVGVVSIGDVVKSRIRELEQDRSQLEHYVTG